MNNHSVYVNWRPSEVGLKISQLSIENFRGIRAASLFFPNHAVLIGDNNVGKSTILEAIDLVMGPTAYRGLRPSMSMISTWVYTSRLIVSTHRS